MKDYQYDMLLGFVVLIHARQMRDGSTPDRIIGAVLSFCGAMLLVVALVEQF